MASDLSQRLVHCQNKGHPVPKRFTKFRSTKRTSMALKRPKHATCQNQLCLHSTGPHYKKRQIKGKIVKKFKTSNKLSRLDFHLSQGTKFTRPTRQGSRITISVRSNRRHIVSKKRHNRNNRDPYFKSSYTKVVKCPKCSRILSMLQPEVIRKFS